MGSYTTLTSKGQLTIPKDVREKLNLKAGTKFYVTERAGSVVAMPKNFSAKDLAGILYREGQRPVSQEEMDEAIMQHVADDDERIVREWNEEHGSSK